MKKLILLLMLCVSFVFGAINLQTASKSELMSIKGIGPKKATQIIEYRKTNKIQTAADLKYIKGFGARLISNIENNEMVLKKKNKMNMKMEEKKVLQKLKVK